MSGDAHSHPDLDAVRSAYERRDWGAALRGLAEADAAVELGADDLWRLAMAAYLTGRSDTFRSALERAHHAHLDGGDPVGAARCAFWLGFWLATLGDAARAGGWLGRAGRLLDGVERDCPERGYLLLPVALRQLGSGDAAAAYATAAGAVEAGQRFDDRDLLTMGVNLQGCACLADGRLEEGLALLDEALVALATDRLSPAVAGVLYCSAIGACRNAWELRRVHAWTTALAEWCARQPELVPYTGECRVYRAEILQLRGEWGDAMAEAERARDHLVQAGDRRAAAGARYRQGELHRLRGELARAEEAYADARNLGFEPQPGLALLRLARGDADAAAAALRRVLAETPQPHRRTRLLPALVEVLLEAGEVEAARDACAGLVDAASDGGGAALAALVDTARGSVELADGQPEAALPPLRRALEAWSALEAPWEAARVRVLLGRACRALDDEDGAAQELAAARADFEALGAAPDVARVDRLTRRAPPRAAHGLTPREREVLTELSTGRTNRAIATRLHISERTVARHVSNILGKLGLPGRAAATAYAWEHGLQESTGQN